MLVPSSFGKNDGLMLPLASLAIAMPQQPPDHFITAASRSKQAGGQCSMVRPSHSRSGLPLKKKSPESEK
jgi:hypothetical protein